MTKIIIVEIITFVVTLGGLALGGYVIYTKSWNTDWFEFVNKKRRLKRQLKRGIRKAKRDYVNDICTKEQYEEYLQELKQWYKNELKSIKDKY